MDAATVAVFLGESVVSITWVIRIVRLPASFPGETLMFVVAPIAFPDACLSTVRASSSRKLVRGGRARVNTKTGGSEPTRPIASVDGHTYPWLISDIFPDVSAVVDDVVVGFEDSVPEPIVAHELPHVLPCVQFRTL